MFKNYFKIAWRNLWKNKVYAAINIMGFAIGIAACILILLFVFYEKSFDSQHTKNIYRLDEVQKFEGMVAPQNVALSMYPMGPTLQNDFPEIKSFTRVRQTGKTQLMYNDKKIFLKDVFLADSTFLRLFDFQLLEGDRNKVLDQPRSIVLTTESAQKIFGKENPIGKTVVRQSDDTIPFVVTGILANIPRNSHLQFDAVVSFNTIASPDLMQNWGGNWLTTYLEIDKAANIAALEKKFPAFLKKHMQGDNWKNYELFLQPLKEVHASSTNITHDYINYQKFDKSYTYIFFGIALVVLLIAGINFMNLATARSMERAKEVGIRKSVGAHRWQLIIQFIGETALLSFIALLMAVVLVLLLLPYVSHLSKRELSFPIFTDIRVLLMALGGALLIGILSSIYPAVYLSSFQAIRVLKGSLATGKNKGGMRNALVVVQFSAAIFLMIATVFALKQLRYMQDKDPGFNKDMVMVIPLNDIANRSYHALKQEWLRNPLVSVVSASQQRLGNNLHQTGVRFKGDGPERTLTSSQVVVDPDYLTLYKIPLIAGNNFTKDKTDNGRTYIVNETLAKELLKETPGKPVISLIGARFGFGGMDSLGTIVGVAKDFNFNSLHHKIETLMMFNQLDWGFSEVSVRISGANTKQAVAFVKSTWDRLVPSQPFEYKFLDDHFQELYQADMTVSEIVGILATLAIIIACLGLFGLASYAAMRRTKEVGIRKVLGASVQNITSLLSMDFIKLVFIANLIAWPVAWYMLDKWLQDFAYRIDISWWIFVVAGIAALLIALFTVSFQAIKAALMNPVKSLRTE
jgi:putative ABC transport system permease protein